MVFLTDKKRSYRPGIEPATFGLCGFSFIELRHQIQGSVAIIYKRNEDLFFHRSKPKTNTDILVKNI